MIKLKFESFSSLGSYYGMFQVILPGTVTTPIIRRIIEYVENSKFSYSNLEEMFSERSFLGRNKLPYQLQFESKMFSNSNFCSTYKNASNFGMNNFEEKSKQYQLETEDCWNENEGFSFLAGELE
jgi:hypothetical protein